MGLAPSGMQPFKLGDSYVVCNGEIYGFEKIKKSTVRKNIRLKRFGLRNSLPMYQEYGTDMFAMLDAEFACIIYDGETGEVYCSKGSDWDPSIVLWV